jgi:hypothetical protein
VGLRVYLNPHVDLEITDAASRAYAAAAEQSQHQADQRPRPAVGPGPGRSLISGDGSAIGNVVAGLFSTR